MSPCTTLHLIFLSSMLDIITSEKKYAENIAGNIFSCLFYNDPVLDYAAFTVHVSWFIIGEILWRTVAIMLQVKLISVEKFPSQFPLSFRARIQRKFRINLCLLSHKKVTSSHVKNNMLSPHVERSILLCLHNKLHFSGVEKLWMSEIFCQHLKVNFVSPCGHVISFLSVITTVKEFFMHNNQHQKNKCICSVLN